MTQSRGDAAPAAGAACTVLQHAAPILSCAERVGPAPSAGYEDRPWRNARWYGRRNAPRRLPVGLPALFDRRIPAWVGISSGRLFFVVSARSLYRLWQDAWALRRGLLASADGTGR